MSPHTPTPWIKAGGRLFEGRIRIVAGPARDLVALVNTGMSGGTADADLIIRAVNNHETLLTWCEALAALIECDPDAHADNLCVYCNASDAIAKAKEVF